MKLPPVKLPLHDPWEVQALLTSLELSLDQVREARALTEQDHTITDIDDFTSSLQL